MSDKSSDKGTGVSQDSAGKSANKQTSTTTAETAQTAPVKVKCDTNTSCDATYPWGSWK